MRIQYIKLLLENKFIYNHNLKLQDNEYTDNDYINYLNNILKSGFYEIKHSKNNYSLLLNKKIFKINSSEYKRLKDIIKKN
jgi:hypothetical protein